MANFAATNERTAGKLSAIGISVPASPLAGLSKWPRLADYDDFVDRRGRRLGFIARMTGSKTVYMRPANLIGLVGPKRPAMH